MASEWLFVDCPIDSDEETHFYIQENDSFARRCDTEYTVSDEEVCPIGKSEAENLIEKDSDMFCPECLRYQTQLIV